MKKGLITLLLVLLLTGCQKENSYLKPLGNEIEVCIEDCYETSDEIHTVYNTIMDKMDLFYEKVAPNRNSEFNLLSEETIYGRDDIIRSDTISDNIDIPIVLPLRKLGNVVWQMRMLVDYCQVGEECEARYVANASYLSDIEYGYNENSGYYSYKAIDENEKLNRVEYGKFNLDDEYGNFEYLTFFPSGSEYLYEYFENGIYYSFHFNGHGGYVFTYVNMNNAEYIYTNFIEGRSSIFYYNHEKEMHYTYFSDSNRYKVSKYDDMEFVTSLTKESEEYSHVINFNFVDGWNKISKTTYSYPQAYSILYIDDTEVFTEHNISIITQGLRYYQVIEEIELLEADFENYDFISEYAGNITIEDLKSSLDSFVNLSDPYNIINIDKQDIIDEMDDYLKQFKKKY